MEEYVAKSVLKKAITSVMPTTNIVDEPYYRGLYNARAIISVTPAADVQEVRHGEWIKNEAGYYECSNCGSVKPHDGIGAYKPEWVTYWTCDYCRVCGAKMDGKEQSNDGLSEQETPKAEH